MTTFTTSTNTVDCYRLTRAFVGDNATARDLLQVAKAIGRGMAQDGDIYSYKITPNSIGEVLIYAVVNGADCTLRAEGGVMSAIESHVFAVCELWDGDGSVDGWPFGIFPE